MRSTTVSRCPNLYFAYANAERFDNRFVLQSALFESKHRLVAVGFDKLSNQEVSIQAVTGLTPGTVVALQHEHAVTHDLSHPSLSRAVDATFHEDSVLLVDEFVEGSSLYQAITQQQFDLHTAIDASLELFDALKTLHQSGVHHLDVRPERVIIQKDGPLKLLRKDVSLREYAENQETRIRVVMFCSPEQTGSIDRDIQASADLYSAGGLMYYMLTGRSPYPGSEISSVLLAHMTAPVPSFKDAGVSVPRAFEQVVRRLLSKDPADRYQTAEAVSFDLQQIKSQLNQGIAEPDLVIGSRDDRSTLIEPSFVGRVDELSRLKDQLHRVARGKSQLVFLEGISGSGKSRLLLELSQLAAAKGFRLFRGQGVEGTTHGLSIFDGTISDVVSAAQNDPAFGRDFYEANHEAWNGLESLFPQLSIINEAAPPPSDHGPNLSEGWVMRTICHYLNELGSADHPALVILDDAQWADSQTHSVLFRWLEDKSSRQDSHVLVLVACRSEEVGHDHPLRRLDAIERLRLGDLMSDEVRLLAESMAGALPSEATDFIVRAANGSPFMASAAVRGLVESEAITYQHGGWRINQRAFDDCQSSKDAGEFLGRRLALLSPETVEFLTAAAIVGKEFDLDAVSHLSECDITASMGALDEARGRNMVWLRGQAGMGAFSHDKIREKLLAGLSDDKCKRLHQKAAEYFAKQRESDAVQVAYHFDAAGAVHDALPFAMSAAEEAEANSSLDVARKLYLIAERGMASAGADTSLRIQWGLGRVLMLLGEYEASEEHFENAKSFTCNEIEEARTFENLAKLYFKKGDLEDAANHYELATQTLRQRVPKKLWVLAIFLMWEVCFQLITTCFPKLLLHRAKRSPNEKERLTISLFSGLAHVCWYSRGKIETFWAHMRSLNLGEKFLPSLELAAAYSEHGPGMSLLGFHRRAIRYGKKSLEIRKSLGDLCAQGQSLSFLAIPLYAGAKFEEAIRIGKEAITLLEGAGDYWNLHIARYQVAASLYRLGRFKESLEACKKNFESARSIGDKQATGHIVDVWSQCTYGDVPRNVLDNELEFERIDFQTRCEVLMADGIAQLRQSEFDRALRQFNEGIRVTKEAGVSNCYTTPIYYWRTHALRRKAEMYVHAVDATKRIETLRQAFWSGLQSLADAWIKKSDVPRIFREIALVRYMQGHSIQARWLLNRSIKLADKLQLKHDYAESLRVLGELGTHHNWPGAQEQLRTARRMLSAIQLEVGTTEGANAETKVTLSLADRFDVVLEVGRRITAALAEEEVFEQTRMAARRLLRCEECAIIEYKSDQESTIEVVSGQLSQANQGIVHSIIQRQETEERAVAEIVDLRSVENQDGSLLCIPIQAFGHTKAYLYAAHAGVRHLFGPTEERLADFIAAIAGASFENSRQYAELQSLNLTLEDRVAERTEQLYRATEEAKSANAAKSDFLATMSHEIRTPMNGILGMTEIALRTQLTAQQRNCLRVVKQSGESLLGLLNQVLDLSKVESARMDLEQIEFNLRESVESAVQLLAASAHAKGLEVNCIVDVDVPFRVVGDATRLRQIVSNLVGNAVKFTNSGHIDVSVRRRRENGVEISVADTGIGISADKQDLIFEAFRQSDSSTTRKFGGTGLGLAICRQLAQLMGGDVEVTSAEGEGSTFTFWVDFHSTEDSQKANGEPTFNGLTAAFISPNASTRHANTSLLSCLGFVVEDFESLDELDDQSLDSFELLVVDTPNQRQEQRLIDCDKPSIAAFLPGKSADCELPTVMKPITVEEIRELALDAMAARPRQERVAEGQAEGHDNQPAKARILLADDSFVNQEVAKGLLEFAGYDVDTADNGCQAVVKSSGTAYDLVLMDLEMPEMDGLEATLEIRKRQPNLPVVVLSAHPKDTLEAKFCGLGVNGFVPKPIDPDVLLTTIQDIFDLRKLATGTERNTAAPAKV